MEWNLEEAVGYYEKQGAPKDQGALTALLREIQRELGGIPQYAVERIAQAYGIPAGVPLALIRRIPSLRLSDTHCLEICAGPNCPKRADLAGFVQRTYGDKPRGFTVKYVPCMRQCGKGPNIRWDGKVYNRADEKLIRELLDVNTWKKI